MTPWMVAHQAPLFMEFSRQEDWSRLPCPSPADLPEPGIKSGSPALQAVSLPQSRQEAPKSSAKVPFLDFRALTGVQRAPWGTQLEPLNLEQKGMCVRAWVCVRVCRGYGRLGLAVLSRVIRKGLTSKGTCVQI